MTTTTAILAGPRPVVTIDTGVLIASPERTGTTRRCEVICDTTDPRSGRRLFLVPEHSSALWVDEKWIVEDYR